MNRGVDYTLPMSDEFLKIWEIRRIRR